mgnify:CR=1 FL=1
MTMKTHQEHTTPERGRAVIISGPSGSGKTTLLNAIGGLDELDSGEISIDVSPLSWNKSRVLIPIQERHGNVAITFAGDSIHPGGNDWPLAQALQASSPHHVIEPVRDCAQTLRLLPSFTSTASALSA